MINGDALSEWNAMPSVNYKMVEFFVSSQYTNKIEFRSNLVSHDFRYISPLAGTLNFKDCYNFLLSIAPYFHPHTDKIVSIDDVNFKAYMIFEVIISENKFATKLPTILNITVKDNLIDEIRVTYDITTKDLKTLETIVSVINERV